MDNNIIIQVFEANRAPLNKMMDLDIQPDGSIVKLRKKRVSRLMMTVTAYILIPVSILFIWAGYSLKTWQVDVIFPFVLIWSIYVVRAQTKIIEINLSNKTISTNGRWQKHYSYSWDGYLGSETVYSVMDFPEEFFINFRKGGKTCKVKLADVNSLFRKSTETNYKALLAFWECIEKKMVEVNNECI